MPNSCKTKITFVDITDEEFVEIVDQFADGNPNGIVPDFDKILPMPSDIYNGEFLSKEIRDTYGANNWYDWRLANWGTKWPAYNGSVDYKQHAFYFTTAWSFAYPVVQKFAELTDATIHAIYSGEFSRNDCGVFTFYPDGTVDDVFPVPDDVINDNDKELWGFTWDEAEEDEEIVGESYHADDCEEDEEEEEEPECPTQQPDSSQSSQNGRMTWTVGPHKKMGQ